MVQDQGSEQRKLPSPGVARKGDAFYTDFIALVRSPGFRGTPWTDSRRVSAESSDSPVLSTGGGWPEI
jgi:hypothetical protein